MVHNTTPCAKTNQKENTNDQPLCRNSKNAGDLAAFPLHFWKRSESWWRSRMPAAARRPRRSPHSLPDSSSCRNREPWDFELWSSSVRSIYVDPTPWAPHTATQQQTTSVAQLIASHNSWSQPTCTSLLPCEKTLLFIIALSVSATWWILFYYRWQQHQLTHGVPTTLAHPNFRCRQVALSRQDNHMERTTTLTYNKKHA